MAFPSFRLRVDDWQDYHVHCQSDLGETKSQALSASDLEFYNIALQSYGMSQKKALTSSKLFNNLVQRLDGHGNRTYSREDINLMLRDSMSKQWTEEYAQREELVQQL